MAIEQASKSVPLQSFQFPEKCAILLGKVILLILSSVAKNLSFLEFPSYSWMDRLLRLYNHLWLIINIYLNSVTLIPIELTYIFPYLIFFLNSHIFFKEREGVPVEVLNHVDYCVEIPQHGLIR